MTAAHVRTALLGGALCGLLVGLGRHAIDQALGRAGGGVVSHGLLFAICAAGLLLIATARRALVAAQCVLLLSIMGSLVLYRVVGTDGASASSTAGGVIPLVSLCAALAFLPAVRGWSVAACWRAVGMTGIALMALPLMPGLGRSYGGQMGVVALPGGVAFMPGELGRPLVLLAVSSLLVSRMRLSSRPGAAAGLADIRPALVPAAVLLGGALVLQISQRDFGPAALLIGGGGGAVALAVGRVRLMALVAGVLVLLVLVGGALLPYVAERVDAVREPLPAPESDVAVGQLGAARLALAWGGNGGVGLGAGLVTTRPAPPDRLDVADLPGLPAAGTDFGLAVVALELGLVSLVVVLLALALLVADLWRRIASAPDDAAYVLAGTITAALTMQGAWVAAAVCGWLPHSGLAFPILSAGGSSAVAVALTIACVVRLTEREASGAKLNFAAAHRLGAVAVLAVGLLALLTAVRVQGEREELNRRIGNPQRIAQALDRGVVLGADGTVLQKTIARQSLQTIERRNLATRPVAAILGDVHTDLTPSATLGLAGAMRAALRCGGSRQAAPEGALWERGATRVHGDPAACEPAGLQTTLDPGLTLAADRAVTTSGGMVAVVRAGTGDVVALAGRRGPGRSATPTDAMTVALPPGSSFKPIVLAAAAERQLPLVAPFRSSYVGVAGARVDGSWCGGTPDLLLEVSCNSAFAALADAVGAQDLAAISDRLMRVPPRVDGMAAGRGQVFAHAGDGGSELSVPWAGIGQGEVLQTPLSLATAFATLASSGIAHPPRLVSATCTADGREVDEQAPSVPRRAIGRDAARTTTEALRGPLRQGGTARDLLALPHVVGAKTGTAEIGPREDIAPQGGNVAWIAALLDAPEQAPLAVVAVVPPTPAVPRPAGGRDAVAVLMRMRTELSGAADRSSAPPCAARPTGSE